MLNTYIKNKGYTKTIIHNKNKNKVNEINWNADYDGEDANIHFTTKTNGRKKTVDIQLDNNDLANLLNIPSVNKPLHKRLKIDFISNRKPPIYRIELPHNSSENDFDSLSEESSDSQLTEIPPFYSPESIQQIPNFISSPLPNDQLIIPVPINSRTSDRYTLTRRKHHIRPKTHRTYRVYKLHKPKSTSRRSTRRRSRTSRHNI